MEAVTRGCYPVEEVELYSEARVEHFAEDELREWRWVVDLAAMVCGVATSTCSFVTW